MTETSKTFEALVAERDRIILSYLSGDFASFSNLREFCKKYNQKSEKNVFDVNGTDERLWRSVSTFFLELLKSHD